MTGHHNPSEATIEARKGWTYMSECLFFRHTLHMGQKKHPVSATGRLDSLVPYERLMNLVMSQRTKASKLEDNEEGLGGVGERKMASSHVSFF